MQLLFKPLWDLQNLNNKEKSKRIPSSCSQMTATCKSAIGTWSVGFCGGRKTGEPGEKPSEEARENQQQTQPTCDAGPTNRTWATAVRGEQFFF